MTVQFSQISPTRRIPLFIAEFSEAASASGGDFVNPSIILAQKLPAASAVAGTRYLISSGGQAADLFGRGSPAHLMAEAFLLNHPTAELYVAAQTDAGGATAASQTLALTGPASGDGTLYLYIAGHLLEVGVADEDTADAIGDAVVAAVTAWDDSPVTAANVTGTVTFTAKVKGTVGNEITLALNVLGQAGGQELPAGVGATLGAATLASGATDPTATLWGTSLGSGPFDVIVYQGDNATALDALDTTVEARWNANSAKDGCVFGAKMDSYADHLTYAAARNAKRLSVASFKEGDNFLAPAYVVAAAYAAVAARELANDPAAPLQGLPLLGVSAYGDGFSDTERDAMANAGCATLTNRAGTVYIEFEATTYRTDAYGGSDLNYETVQSVFCDARVRREFAQAIRSAYPRHKLADDDTPIASGQRIVTPSILKAFCISVYERLVAQGMCEDLEAFKAGITIERNASNRNRIDGYITPNYIDQARVFAFNIARRS